MIHHLVAVSTAMLLRDGGHHHYGNGHHNRNIVSTHSPTHNRGYQHTSNTNAGGTNPVQNALCRHVTVCHISQQVTMVLPSPPAAPVAEPVTEPVAEPAPEPVVDSASLPEPVPEPVTRVETLPAPAVPPRPRATIGPLRPLAPQPVLRFGPFLCLDSHGFLVMGGGGVPLVSFG